MVYAASAGQNWSLVFNLGEALLDKAMHLCQANFGGLLIFDGERMKPAVCRLPIPIM